LEGEPTTPGRCYFNSIRSSAKNPVSDSKILLMILIVLMIL
jgi:hypothetical protein